MFLRQQLRNAVTFVLERVSRCNTCAISVSNDHKMTKHMNVAL